MSQLSLAFDASLMIRDEQGRYLPATAEQILEAARKVIDQKVQRGAAFTSSELVKDYLIAKLGGFEHEVFSALFLDARATRECRSMTTARYNQPSSVGS